MLGELSLTEFLALAFGLYMIAAGIGLLSEGDNYNQILSEFKDNAALGYIAGIMAFALGVVIVRLHNDWSSVVAGVVSLIGWAALVEGVLMLAFRRAFLVVGPRAFHFLIYSGERSKDLVILIAALAVVFLWRPARHLWLGLFWFVFCSPSSLLVGARCQPLVLDFGSSRPSFD